MNDEEMLALKMENSRRFIEHISMVTDHAFAHIAIGAQVAREHTARPDAEQFQTEASTILSGSLIIYLFAMWDQFFEHSDIQTYFREHERERFYAYKHIRHCFAHNIDGSRYGNRSRQDRMSHADKLDAVMSSEAPLQGISVTEESISLTFPDAVLNCRQFLQDMALKLGCGRFAVGKAHGQVRVAGGGYTEVI